jgi:hypothetical protein
MIVLHGSGAGVTEIFGPALPEDDWQSLRRNTGRLLTARGHTKAASILQRFPFELRGGTNYFQDEFSLLYAVLPLEQCIQIEEIKSSSAGSFQLIADTMSEIGCYTRFVVAELEAAEGPSPVPPPSPQVTSEAVEAALSDAEHLIRAKGPSSALDRVHTALHGYLRVVLDREKITYEPGAPITRLFKLLREKHPALRDLGARSEDLWRIVMSTASVVDALNVLRNNASIAHPNEGLLEDAEAMLAINSARTLFHYLDAKVEG